MNMEHEVKLIYSEFILLIYFTPTSIEKHFKFYCVWKNYEMEKISPMIFH